MTVYDDFIELQNSMGILQKMEAGIYSKVETKRVTPSPSFCKYIKETIKRSDGYAKIEIGSIK